MSQDEVLSYLKEKRQEVMNKISDKKKEFRPMKLKFNYDIRQLEMNREKIEKSINSFVGKQVFKIESNGEIQDADQDEEEQPPQEEKVSKPRGRGGGRKKKVITEGEDNGIERNDTDNPDKRVEDSD